MPTSIPDSFRDRLDSVEKTVANLARDLRALRTVVDRLDQRRDGATAHPIEPESVPVPVAPEAEDQRPAERLTATERPAATERLIGTERLTGTGRRSLDLESLIGRYGTLALALVHVAAWGAGPYLHLVASPVALGVAAAASAALAVLAWVNDEEALFSVGVGGALVAHFVTSRDSGNDVAQIF